MDSTSCTVVARRKRVLELTGFSDSGLDREVARGLFPPPVALSPDPQTRAVGWPLIEVETVTRAKIAGIGVAGLRELVERLIVERAHARESHARGPEQEAA